MASSCFMGKEMLLSSKVLTLIAHKMKLNEFANSIAPEEWLKMSHVNFDVCFFGTSRFA